VRDVVALAILTAVAVGCEGWVRRREKRLKGLDARTE